MSTPAHSARPHAAAELAVDIDTAAVADVHDLRDAVGERPDLPLEADPADVAAQESASLDDAAGARFELPLEADPADVAEQAAAVPYDDEERQDY